MFPLMFGISGFTKKPGIVGDTLVSREYLTNEREVNHAVDGAEAARFLKRLGELFTGAFGQRLSNYPDYDSPGLSES
jgi:hypothetical protein